MTLQKARVLFTSLIAQLVLKAFEWGYEVALAEGMDRKTAKDPTSDHMDHSLHDIGLAQDLDLFLDGIYQDKSEQHQVLGEYWEGLHPACHWGGTFGDGNHYSLSDPSIPGCMTLDGRLRK